MLQFKSVVRILKKMVISPRQTFGDRRGSLLLLTLLLLWGILTSALISAGLGGISGPLYSQALNPSDIVHDQGCAYVTKIAKGPLAWPLFEYIGDSNYSIASRLQLFENGKPLSNPHALHADIRSPGNSAYSHWHSSLWFSASDCSDPRTNGKRYEFSVPATPSVLSYGLLVILWIYFAWLSKKRFDSSELSFGWGKQLGLKIAVSPTSLMFPMDMTQRSGLAVVLAVFMILVTLSISISALLAGVSKNFAVAGFYPTSDAAGYWTCAMSFIHNGFTSETATFDEWCQRRVIYPAFLSGLNLIAARDTWLTLALQAGIVAIAAFVLLRRLSRLLPSAAIIVAGVLLLAYATDHLLFQTMTENAGFVGGCLALALLWRATEERSLSWLVAGTATLSIALNARAGAFFALLALIPWAGLLARSSGRHVRIWIAATGIAIFSGFALQTSLVLALGGDPFMSHGNFSYTLYGLSIGGKGWSQIFVDHPEIFITGSDMSRSKAIYALAWQNIITRPTALIEGITRNIELYWTSGTYGFGRLGLFGPAAKIFWWLAWIPLLLRWRDPRFLLIALLSLGAMVSAPILLQDGGNRLFAATVAVDVTQIAIGFAVFVTVVSRALGIRPIELVSQERRARKDTNVFSLEAVVSLIILAIVILPFVPAARLNSHTAVTFDGCAVDERAVVTQINRGGNVTLRIISDDQRADFLRGEVRRDALMNGIPATFWWRNDVMSFSGGSLVLDYLLDTNDPNKHGPFNAYVASSLRLPHGKVVGLCLDNRDSLWLFGVEYFRLVSVTELE